MTQMNIRPEAFGHNARFTAVFDQIIEAFPKGRSRGTDGYVIALLFGKVWRYCKGTDGPFWASQKRLAREMGLSRRTV